MGWGKLAALHGPTSIRVMSFSRLRNSQFDAFVSSFVHEFNWFLIRSIYSCHVSLIIIGQAICSTLTDWYDLNTLIQKDFGSTANDFHVHCIIDVLRTKRRSVKEPNSLTTNGTAASATEVFPFIESTQNQKPRLSSVECREKRKADSEIHVSNE